MKDKIMKNVLLLGGTLEARRLAKALSRRDDIKAIISLAGVTSAPPDFGLEKRIGGFGGIQGLVDYIKSEAIDILIDATHPYAKQMSHHAAAATLETGITRLALNRPPWQAEPGDDWQEFASWDDLIAAIPQDAHIFLAAGQDGMIAFDRQRSFAITARALEEPQGLNHPINLIKSLPQSAPEDEIDLFQEHGITHLVCKNSGGTASTAKLIAARHLGMKVLMLARPPFPTPLFPQGESLADIDAILSRL